MSDVESEKIITTSCAPHCGGGCILKVHVKDGVINRIETDDGDHTQVRACLRGRSWRQRIYHPDRLEYPLKRTGDRGEGRFERISWDEAFDTIVGEIKRIVRTYGPGSLVYWISGGDQGLFDTWERMGDIFCGVGGYTRPWGLHSYEGAIFAELATFGSAWTHGTRDDLVNARMIIMWGWDPSTTIHDTNTAYFLAQAREDGTRIVSIDPRYTASSATFAHQWIPIRPGADTAMLIAMANVMVTEDLQDQAFLDTYTLGFEAFKGYVLGTEDGVPKTPEWAEGITDVPAATIRKLAREYATTKPAALIAGIGPGRSAYGEQYHRAAITLAAMTGNIGISGGSCGGKSWGPPILMENNPDPVAKPNSVQDQVDNLKKISGRSAYIWGEGVINLFRLTDAILKGKAGGYPTDYKFLYLNNSNVVNQWPNTNKTIEAFNKLDFIVIEEQFMTATAKHADIVLPSTTCFERNDMTLGSATPYFLSYRQKVIEPPGEARPALHVGNELARRLGITDYNKKTDEEYTDDVIRSQGLDPEVLKRDGPIIFELPEPHVPFRKEIEDPENNPFKTPSGKIEIYSELLAEMNDPNLPPIPKYIEPWESRNDPLASKYPLQLITTHTRRRAHTQFDNVPWLRELDPHSIRMNSVDAEERGIEDGDLVKVFNDRGIMIIPAKILETIMPGVVDLPQGAWYDPDENGVDRGGCANVLTDDRPSPGGAMPSNTALVQIEKA